MNIGYYAHHHGTGHCRQADKLAEQLRLKSLQQQAANTQVLNSKVITVFTSMTPEAYTFRHINQENIVRLPNEHERLEDILPGRAGKYWQPECMHYSPVGNINIQRRSQILLSQVETRQIKLMVVDLSVEIALLCRTASIPYLYVRLPGNRDDTPHRNAFEGAIALLAPYPALLESADTPEWIRQKTLYLGFPTQSLPQVSKADFIRQVQSIYRTVASKNSEANWEGLAEQFIVTIIKGFGGHEKVDNLIPKLRYLLPNAFIISLGPIELEAEPFVDLATRVDDVSPYLQHSNLLIMACGLNAIGEACQFNTPLLAVPDERPHAEQAKMAQALTQCGRALDIQWLESNLASLNVTSNKAITSLPRPSKTLVNTLMETRSAEFITSIGLAKNAKTWFYDWLLPQLAIKPERQTS